MKKIIITMLAVLVLIFTGCATSKPIMTPSGNQGYSIWCEDVSYCWQEAAKKCPQGYKIMDKGTESEGYGNFSGGGGFMAVEENGYMLIECNDSYREPAPKQQAAAASQKPVTRKQVARKNLGAEKLVYNWNQRTPQKIDEFTTLDNYSYDGIRDAIVVNYTLHPVPAKVYEPDFTEKHHTKVLGKICNDVKERRSLRYALDSVGSVDYEYYDKSGKLLESVSLDNNDLLQCR